MVGNRSLSPELKGIAELVRTFLSQAEQTREQDLVTLEQTFGGFDASFVTASVAQMPVIQRGDWWYWVY